MSKPLPRYADIYGSQYVSPDDFPNGKTVTVKILALEALELTCIKGGRPVKNTKIVATCADCKKKLAINKTSAKRLAMAWGQDFNAWLGKSVTVTGGEVNGKPATLLTPVQEPRRAGPLTAVDAVKPAPIAPADDLSFAGNIPDDEETA